MSCCLFIPTSSDVVLSGGDPYLVRSSGSTFSSSDLRDQNIEKKLISTRFQRRKFIESFRMNNSTRRSSRTRSSLNVKFADDPDYDEQTFEDDQGDDDDDDIDDELPVARIKQEQQRHTSNANENHTNSGIDDVKRRRGRPAKREPTHGEDEDDDEDGDEHWQRDEQLNADVTLSPSGPDGNPSVYEFRCVSSNEKRFRSASF